MPKVQRLAPYETPTLPPHRHPGPCDCILAVAYIRVSMLGNRTKVKAPKNQLDVILDYANEHNLRLMEIIMDINRSGTTFKKRSVNKILSDIELGKYRYVVMWEWSRWSRNQFEQEEYLNRLEDLGGAAFSATEPSDRTTASGRGNIRNKANQNQEFSEKIGENWRKVQASRREEGLPHSGRARFGYQYVTQVEENEFERIEVNKYLIDEGENGQAAMLKSLYEQYAFDPSSTLLDLVNQLNKKNFRTAFGNRWCQQSLVRMLDTGFGAGYIRERSQPAKNKPANTRQSYDILRLGAHAAIISDEVWQAFEARRDRQARASTPRTTKHRVLSSLLFCRICHYRLCCKTAGPGKIPQWQCFGAKPRHPGVSVTVADSLAIAATRAWINQIATLDSDEINALVVEQVQAQAEPRRSRKAINSEIATLEANIENLISMSASGGLSEKIKQRYIAKLQSCEAQIEALQSELVAPSPISPSRLPDFDAFKSFDEEWDRLDTPLLNKALMNLTRAIVVGPRVQGVSTRKSAVDRIEFIGSWDSERIAEWETERSALINRRT